MYRAGAPSTSQSALQPEVADAELAHHLGADELGVRDLGL